MYAIVEAIFGRAGGASLKATSKDISEKVSKMQVREGVTRSCSRALLRAAIETTPERCGRRQSGSITEFAL